jgi:hypothetical protein
MGEQWNLLAARQRLQPLRRERQQHLRRSRRHPDIGRLHQALAQFLGDDCVVVDTAAKPALLLGQRDHQPAEFGKLRPLRRHIGTGSRFLLDPAARRIAEHHLLFRGENLHAHRIISSAGCQR